MMATFVHVGDRVNYTPSAAVSGGDVVVQGQLFGVATDDIAADELGSIAVSGVFDISKATGSSEAITAGADLYWDSGDEVATATVGSNVYIGKAVEAATDSDATVRVRLSQ